VEQQQTLEANEAAYKLAEERYRAGLASYLSVLNAETQVLTARQTMVDIVADEAVARVTLLSAIGGSFDARASIAGTAPNSPQVLTRVTP
jgi:outer membrane protein TolC